MLAASRAEAAQYGIFKTGTAGRIVLPILLALLGGAGAIVFGVILLDNAFGGLLPLLLLLPGILITIIVFGLTARKPLTDKGAELRDHLEGLREYIRLAEADRLKVLQSPSGADRSPVSTDDPREVLKLNEKLLPYAVLFGLEKEWAEELSKYYVDESPDWYAGSDRVQRRGVRVEHRVDLGQCVQLDVRQLELERRLGRRRVVGRRRWRRRRRRLLGRSTRRRSSPTSR